ncbi:MAG TPA: tripartite tricarboxylate transporter substrate binding protein [Burkholderiales bacterium]|nr:tripartite tricarboxylate transporter substrate binding protein [Burkholderiales bacterium]
MRHEGQGERIRGALSIAFSVGLALASAQAGAEYPERAVRLVVCYAPGGSNDIVARALSPRLTQTWGQPVIVDNRPGGNTVIGTELVAKAAADGYTLLITPPSFTINPGLSAKLPYDALRDFTPVTLININPQLLLVNPHVPASSVKELIALARSMRGRMNYSSSGSGGANHLAGELFKSMAGVQIAHIPYKGNAPSLTALAGGEVDMAINSIPSALPLMRAAKVRALAVTSMQRSSALPELPTLDESGLKGYEAVAWTGVNAPAGTPAIVVEKIASSMAAIIQSAEFRERLKADGSDPAGSTPEQYGRFVRAELEKWRKMIASARVTAE